MYYSSCGGIGVGTKQQIRSQILLSKGCEGGLSLPAPCRIGEFEIRAGLWDVLR